MKTFTSLNPKDVKEAVSMLSSAQQQGRSASIVGGGSDLLGMVKEHLVQPDVLVNLRSIKGLDKISEQKGELIIGALVTLDAIHDHPVIKSRYTVLSEAAGVVGTPQLRNAGTIAGNISQRPWCWYYRNGFPCFKNGGTTCFSVTGENELHAIFGGGPSFIVHPSDTAPALVALNAKFRIAGPKGERTVAASDFFQLPKVDASRENILEKDEIVTAIQLPQPKSGTRSTYHKVLDREAWTHAVVSIAAVIEMDRGTCRSARVVMGGVAPIPWRLEKIEAMLAGQRITPELAAKAGEAAIEGANPLAKNRYKLPLTKNVVKRTLQTLGSAA
jgi:xanthine dehydrogenase YagS FAD-binding subunit